jgi:colanic acid biosynthesis protein WcaH
MSLAHNINALEKAITDPRVELPEEIFRFLSRITPIVNVDLLVKDERGRCLLAWRADEFAEPGWHVPGGIIRYRETMTDRLMKTAVLEIGCVVKYSPLPFAVHEIFSNNDTRGHFISFIYNCYMESINVPVNHNLRCYDSGYLQWHDKAPKNLIKVHERYRNYINDKDCIYKG